jgi:Fur family transcriptional regulator, ferric uptake regulator
VTVAHSAAPIEARNLDAAAEAVRATGLRLTAARRLLLGALWDASEPLSAERLSELAGNGTDVASVYRNLEAFERIGLIRHFHVGHGPGLYARTSLGAREYLICDACGRLQAVEPGRLDGVRELIRRDFGHEASFTHFPIAGLCRDCAP